MIQKSRKKNTYRHAPAFILLFLAMEDLYGAALLNTIQKELPYFHMDSAVIYRSLQELEEEGSVTSYWETTNPGPARKWYTITNKGRDRLIEFKNDIEMRKKNFEFFLTFYNKLSK